MELREPISSIQYDDVFMGDAELYGWMQSLATSAAEVVYPPPNQPLTCHSNTRKTAIFTLWRWASRRTRPPCFVILHGLHTPARLGPPASCQLCTCGQEEPTNEAETGQNGAAVVRAYQNTLPDGPLFPPLTPEPTAMPPLPAFQWPPVETGGAPGLPHDSSSSGHSMGGAADRVVEEDGAGAASKGNNRAGRPRAVRRRGSGGSGDEDGRHHAGSPIHKTESDRDKNRRAAPSASAMLCSFCAWGIYRGTCGHAAKHHCQGRWHMVMFL